MLSELPMQGPCQWQIWDAMNVIISMPVHGAEKITPIILKSIT